MSQEEKIEIEVDSSNEDSITFKSTHKEAKNLPKLTLYLFEEDELEYLRILGEEVIHPRNKQSRISA
jgi:hypothetical protein